MKKTLLLALAGVMSLGVGLQALADVSVVNRVGETIYVDQLLGGPVVRLLPGQSHIFNHNLRGNHFNIRVPGPNGLVTLCTIEGVANGQTLHVRGLLGHSLSSGCFTTQTPGAVIVRPLTPVNRVVYTPGVYDPGYRTVGYRVYEPGYRVYDGGYVGYRIYDPGYYPSEYRVYRGYSPVGYRVYSPGFYYSY